MKRDMDLCREILIEVEKAEYRGVGEPVSLKVENSDNDAISYHIMLLSEAGLIQAVDRNYGAPGGWRAVRLTWDGHEFLEAARDSKRWEKAKGAMAQVGGFVFDVGKQLLIQYLRAELKLQ
jgi:Hypothetical protein (DUF2513)